MITTSSAVPTVPNPYKHMRKRNKKGLRMDLGAAISHLKHVRNKIEAIIIKNAFR